MQLRMITLTLALAVSTAALAETKPMDVNALNKILTDNHATWVAKPNHISNQSVENQKRLLGYKRPANRSAEFQIPNTKAGTTIVDWRNQQGLNWVSPILDQGNCGSCVAFASVGTLETQVNIARKMNWLNPRFSPQALFACSGGGCETGMDVDTAVSYLKKTGIPDEDCAPYTMGATDKDVSCSNFCADEKQRIQKIADYKSLNGPDAVKAALAKGPVVTTLNVYADFMDYSSGIYKHVTGDLEGGHAVSIVGYNDVDRYWIIRNSWATDWGENGFANISYDDISGVGQEGWSMTIPNAAGTVAFKDLLDDSYAAGTMTVHATSTYQNATGMNMVLNNATGIVSSTPYTCATATDCAFSIDTTKLADGRYEVQLQSTSGSTVLGTSEKKFFYVLNNAPSNMTVTVANSAGGDLSKSALTGELQLAVGLQSAPVPYNFVRIVVEQNGAVVRSTGTALTADQMQIGWNTARLSNGQFQMHIEATITVGSQVYTAKSQVYNVTVKN